MKPPWKWRSSRFVLSALLIGAWIGLALGIGAALNAK